MNFKNNKIVFFSSTGTLDAEKIKSILRSKLPNLPAEWGYDAPPRVWHRILARVLRLNPAAVSAIFSDKGDLLNKLKLLRTCYYLVRGFYPSKLAKMNLHPRIE